MQNVGSKMALDEGDTDGMGMSVTGREGDVREVTCWRGKVKRGRGTNGIAVGGREV
jgi:hypothetical protein